MASLCFYTLNDFIILKNIIIKGRQRLPIKYRVILEWLIILLNASSTNFYVRI